MTDTGPVLALTPGEPAGIGTDLAVLLRPGAGSGSVVLIASPVLLEEAAARLGLVLDVPILAPGEAPPPGPSILPVTLAAPVTPGVPDPANAGYVLETLETAIDGCLAGRFDAMVTGPVHKATINAAGHVFSGHTELIAARCGVERTVMLLVAGTLRVALLTTHVPLSAVPALVTTERLGAVTRILDAGLRSRFGIRRPRIAVCGLNPHAGESGYLGREEIEIMEPALHELACSGIRVEGPLPADTAFTPARLEHCDAVLAMYHDQGLPVLKHAGFGRAVNVTLGLPIVRTSVDHGTALDRAGSGDVDTGSLRAAVALARELAARTRGTGPARTAG